MARPRKKGRRDLPINLYVDARGFYSYKHPITKRTHGMGSNRNNAVSASRELNSILTKEKDLVSSVLGEKDRSVSEIIDYYIFQILPQRDYADNTLKLYTEKANHIKEHFKQVPINHITVLEIANFLNLYPDRSSNQHRQIFIQIFKHAVGKGLVDENIAEKTLPKIEKKQRKRLSLEQFELIYRNAPLHIQNAMDLSLITLQRRSDISKMKFSDIKDGYLYVIQEKTKKHDTSYLKIKITNELQLIIDKCKDDIDSPYIIHKRKLNNQNKLMHKTFVSPRMITEGFSNAMKKSGISNTSFHEIRALGIKLYKDKGIDPQKLAGHSSSKMTKNYDSGHDEIRWIDIDFDKWF